MTGRAAALRDAAFIAAIAVLSLAWYVRRLGFYSDDWAFLGLYATSADQSIRGLYDASYSGQHAMRPVQLWLCAALYRAFGMNVQGYHVFNALLVVANPLLVYAVARELRAPRNVALAVGLIYGVLPSYSTDRFWYVAFAITGSMTAALIAFYADLRAWAAANDRSRRGPAAAILWKIGALGAIAISVLAYEVTLPLLMVGTPVALVLRYWQERAWAMPRRSLAWAAAIVAIDVVLLGGITMFKVRTTVRLGAEQGVTAQVADIARYALRRDLQRGEYGLNALNAIRVHFVEYGIQLPMNALALARSAPSAVRALTVIAAAAIFLYLALALRAEPWPRLGWWILLGASGIGVFALGYAIFLTNYNVQFTPTGIANRSAIAAALGSAMCLIAVAGLASTLAGPRARGIVFAAAVALIAGSGIVIINAVADRWIAAYAEERVILSTLRDRLPSLPAQPALLLEGACPYVGPAIVFEANWDLTGALQVYYRTRSVAANVVTPRMTADDEGITATIYNQPTRYPYSPALLGVHARTGAIQPLPDAATGRAWLARALAAASCPSGREGLGVEPF